MSHIDESRLHEYLDALERGQDFSGRAAEQQGSITFHRQASPSVTGRGAVMDWDAVEQHLAACSECRAQLDEVRAVRGRASALLSEAAPARIAMPPFEEIEARARARTRRSPRRVFTMNRLAAVGWAATLVLAVGIGWLARGSFEFGQRQEMAPIATRASQPTAELDLATAGDEALPSSVTESARAAPPAVGGRGAAVPDSEPEGQVVAPPPEVPVDARERVAEEGAAEREQLAKAAPTESPTRQVAAEGALEPEARRDVPAAGLAAQVVSTDAIGQQLNRAVADASWRSATMMEAAAHLGDSLKSIVGLEIDSITIGEVDGSRAVRILQVLASGERVEIVQWRRDDPDAPVWRAEAFADRIAAMNEPQPATTLVTSNGYVVALRAPLEADSLQALAKRIH